MNERRLHHYAEWAWTIIANAGGGDWTKETNEWQKAAANWRNQYHAECAALIPSDNFSPQADERNQIK